MERKIIRIILALSTIYFIFGTLFLWAALSSKAKTLPNNYPVDYDFQGHDFTLRDVSCGFGTGDSMSPTFSENNVLCWKKADFGEIHPGNIVLFKNEYNIIVAHRVKSIKNNTIVTRGDNNIDKERINSSQLLGVVVAIVYS